MFTHLYAVNESASLSCIKIIESVATLNSEKPSGIYLFNSFMMEVSII